MGVEHAKALIIGNVLGRVRRMLDANRRSLGFPRDLAGACGVSSACIHTLLEVEGVPAQIIGGHFHYYVVCDDLALDVTATQFGRAPIMVMGMQQLQRLATHDDGWRWWYPHDRYSSISEAGLQEELLWIQGRVRWPPTP